MLASKKKGLLCQQTLLTSVKRNFRSSLLLQGSNDVTKSLTLSASLTCTCFCLFTVEPGKQYGCQVLKTYNKLP